MTVVVADLGASNARFAIYEKGKMSDVYQFACDDFKTATALIESFVAVYAPSATYLLAGVPGAVHDNQVKWTNRSWSLDGAKLKKKLHLKQVVLMNDLAVQGFALPALKKKDLLFLQQNKSGPGPKVLVNVGTGLGASLIFDDIVYPAEYGQTLVKFDTLEHEISGPGFKRLYQKNKKTKKAISAVKIAQDYFRGDRAAQETYKTFYEKLGRALANLALTVMATGGVYICGGILDEKTLKEIHMARFFSNHPRMNHVLKQMPLIYIKRKDFAFLGLKRLVKKFGWS